MTTSMQEPLKQSCHLWLPDTKWMHHSSQLTKLHSPWRWLSLRTKQRQQPHPCLRLLNKIGHLPGPDSWMCLHQQRTPCYRLPSHPYISKTCFRPGRSPTQPPLTRTLSSRQASLKAGSHRHPQLPSACFNAPLSKPKQVSRAGRTLCMSQTCTLPRHQPQWTAPLHSWVQNRLARQAWLPQDVHLALKPSLVVPLLSRSTTQPMMLLKTIPAPGLCWQLYQHSQAASTSGTPLILR